MFNLYGFRDKKSGVLSNLFITSDPFSRVQQSVSISLLELSFKEKTSPYVLFSEDFDLVKLAEFPDELKEIVDLEFVNCSSLLAASRKAFNAGKDQTSQDEVLEMDKEL